MSEPSGSLKCFSSSSLKILGVYCLQKDAKFNKIQMDITGNPHSYVPFFRDLEIKSLVASIRSASDGSDIFSLL